MAFGTITEEQARGMAAACTDAPAHVRALFLLLPYSRSVQALADDYAFTAAAAWIEAHPEREAGARFLQMPLPQFAEIIGYTKAGAQHILRRILDSGALEQIATHSRHHAPVYAFALADDAAGIFLEYQQTRVNADTLNAAGTEPRNGFRVSENGVRVSGFPSEPDTNNINKKKSTPQTPHAPRVAAAPGEEGERVLSFIDQWRIGGADDGNADG